MESGVGKEEGKLDGEPVEVYVRAKCPFCTRLLIFLAEARLLDRVRVAVVDGDEHLLRRLREHAARDVTFPAARFERDGSIEMDTETLMRSFEQRFAVDRADLFVLRFYTDGVMKNQSKLVQAMGLQKALDIIYDRDAGSQSGSAENTA
mmetsp:Transcript_10633/g.28363  ORF Transcript_10633/g.28363 Transcript_10633/m.28363 type:complete len:149 (-) Transcript_10633:330-776(-)